MCHGHCVPVDLSQLALSRSVFGSHNKNNPGSGSGGDSGSGSGQDSGSGSGQDASLFNFRSSAGCGEVTFDVNLPKVGLLNLSPWHILGGI